MANTVEVGPNSNKTVSLHHGCVLLGDGVITKGDHGSDEQPHFQLFRLAR